MAIRTFEIDLLEDIPVSLNFSIQDIREPSTRQGSFSKTIKLPSTNRNNEVFKKVYNLSYDIQTSGATQYSDGDFNPNLKLPIILYDGMTELFRGDLKLERIVYFEHSFYYECTIYGKLLSFWNNMGDSKMTDLDLSAYNHTYNITSISSSWNPTIGQGYVYPMINWGFGSQVNYKLEHWKPAVFVKDYLDKIFMTNGYQYASDFFNTTFFKSLIIPATTDRMKLSYAQVLARQLRASRTSTQQHLYDYQTSGLTELKSVIFNDDSTTPNNDPSSQYDTGNGIATITNKGVYNISCSLDVNLLLNPLASTTSTAEIEVFAFIKRLKPNGGSNTYANGIVRQLFKLAQNGTINNNDVTGTKSFVFDANGIQLDAGDKIYVQFYVSNNPLGLPPPRPALYASTTGTVTVQVLNNSYLAITVGDASLQEGDTVDMSSVAPEDMRQADFIANIIKLFNLYIEEDKSTPNKLIIEPFVDYYSSGVTLDWTEKLDVSQELVSEPMTVLEARRYILTMDRDNDYYSQYYFNKYNETYGQKNVDVTNDWLTSVKELKNGFASTPSVLVQGTDRVIPHILTYDNAGHPQPKASKPRILYWGGLTNTTSQFSIKTASTTYTYSQYPYCGHVDSISNPDYDVNFNNPREVFYNATTYTTGNLYNEYWRQYIEEITDRNSKIVTGYFYLTPSDIRQLDFRNKIFLKGVLYRINKVIDYNPINNGLTKVELIKVKSGFQFSGRTKPTVNAGGSSDEDVSPVYSTLRVIGANNNLSYNNYNYVNGEDNFVAYNTTGVTVTGIGNSVHGECYNINIENSSGCTVVGGLNDVSIVNTSGVTVTESNIMYINNELMFHKTQSAVYINLELFYLTKTSKLFVNTYNSGSINWYLPNTGLTNNYEVKVKNNVNMGVNTCTLHGNGYNIDGSSTLDFTTQYVSYTLRFMNDSWAIV